MREGKRHCTRSRRQNGAIGRDITQAKIKPPVHMSVRVFQFVLTTSSGAKVPADARRIFLGLPRRVYERLFLGRESRSDPFDERCGGAVSGLLGHRLGIFLRQFEHALNCAECGFTADDLLLDEYMQKTLAKKQRHFSLWIRSGFGASHEHHPANTKNGSQLSPVPLTER